MRKISLLLCAVAFLFSANLARGSSTALAHDEALRVYYLGAGDETGSVLTALKLAKFELVETVEAADVLVLNGAVPDPAAVRTSLETGSGVMMILGPQVTAEEMAGIFGSPVQLTPRSDPVTLKEAAQTEELQDTILEDILWNTAPQLRERYELSQTELLPLIHSLESSEMLLGKTSLDNGRLYLTSAWLEGDN